MTRTTSRCRSGQGCCRCDCNLASRSPTSTHRPARNPPRTSPRPTATDLSERSPSLRYALGVETDSSAFAVTEGFDPDGTPVLAVTGDLDLVSAPTLGQHLTELARQGTQRAIVDVADVSFIDSSGVRAIISSAPAVPAGLVDVSAPLPHTRRPPPARADRARWRAHHRGSAYLTRPTAPSVPRSHSVTTLAAAAMTPSNHLEQEIAVIALSADPVSIPHARQFVCEQTRHLDDPDLSATLELLVSEIVTNAILHSPAPRNLRLVLDNTRVRVEVEDRGERAPRMSESIDLLKSNGRGLHIVDRLSSSWGYDPVDTGGKVVWFELKRG